MRPPIARSAILTGAVTARWLTLAGAYLFCRPDRQELARGRDRPPALRRGSFGGQSSASKRASLHLRVAKSASPTATDVALDRDARLESSAALSGKELAIHALRAGAVVGCPAACHDQGQAVLPRTAALETPHLPFKSPSTSWRSTAFRLASPCSASLRRWHLLRRPDRADARRLISRSDASIIVPARPIYAHPRLQRPPASDLDAEVSEPTGLLMDRLLPARTDHAR